MKLYYLPLILVPLALGYFALANNVFLPDAAAPPPSIALILSPERMPDPGKSARVVAELTKDGKPLTEDELRTVHTKKFHLLVIDPTFTDYQHLHPEPTHTPGGYLFTFTPKLKGGYRAWADVTPMDGNQEFAMADLGKPAAAHLGAPPSDKAIVQGYRFGLSFDETPAEGEEIMGNITVLDKNGKEVRTLEPVMGAFAHIVGFYDDYETVVHTHAMGDEPESDADRAGPTVMFHLAPEQAGMLRLFAQFKINGQEIFAPFTVKIEPTSRD